MRVLLPIPKKQWRTPSQAQQKNSLGHENQTRFRIRALTHDGASRWVGWFDDRDDADAFLWAVASGSLPYERELWDLPVETWMPGYGYGNVGWRPDLGDGLLYDFVTVVFVVSGSSWSVPSDCSGVSGQSGEFIDTIGAGGSGGARRAGSPPVSGGGGGACSRVTSGVSLTPNGSVTISIASSVAGITQSVSGATAGNVGPDTWFNGANLAASSVGAKGGGAGVAPGSIVSSQALGGAAASGIGSTKNSGGNSGATGAFTGAASGAGGAAGPNGAGVAGTDNVGGSSGTAGGAGNNNTSGGGAGSAGIQGGGAQTSSPGGAGTTYDATHGPGGGSGGASTISTGIATSGAGGVYGAGSGGANGVTGGVSGSAGPGLIVVSYAPATKKYIPNLAMLGW